MIFQQNFSCTCSALFARKSRIGFKLCLQGQVKESVVCGIGGHRGRQNEGHLRLNRPVAIVQCFSLLIFLQVSIPTGLRHSCPGFRWGQLRDGELHHRPRTHWRHPYHAQVWIFPLFIQHQFRLFFLVHKRASGILQNAMKMNSALDMFHFSLWMLVDAPINAHPPFLPFIIRKLHLFNAWWYFFLHTVKWYHHTSFVRLFLNVEQHLVLMRIGAMGILIRLPCQIASNVLGWSKGALVTVD